MIYSKLLKADYWLKLELEDILTTPPKPVEIFPKETDDFAKID